MRFIRDIIENHQQAAAVKQAPSLESIDVYTSSSSAPSEFKTQDCAFELTQKTAAPATEDLCPGKLGHDTALVGADSEDLLSSIQDDQEPSLDWDSTDTPQNAGASDKAVTQSATEDSSGQAPAVALMDPLNHQEPSVVSDDMADPDLCSSDKIVSRRKLHTVTPHLEERLANQIASTIDDTDQTAYASQDVEDVPAGHNNTHVKTDTQDGPPISILERTTDTAPSSDEQDGLAPSHEQAVEEPTPVSEPLLDGHQAPAMVAERQTHPERDDDVPPPETGGARSRSSRAKTRLLGFNIGPIATDPMSRLSEADKSQEEARFPVGWLVVVEGAGRGHSFQLSAGVAKIGRGEGQDIRIDFGDSSISRENHAAIAYDMEQNAFFLGHGGKSNIVRRNNRPVLSTEELVAGDMIRIGETKLRFVPLCGGDFSWDASQHVHAPRAGLG